MKTLSVIASALTLASCASSYTPSPAPPEMVWSSKPNGVPGEFDRDNYKCYAETRQYASPYTAYQLCMEARGYRLVPQQQQ